MHVLVIYYIVLDNGYLRTGILMVDFVLLPSGDLTIGRGIRSLGPSQTDITFL